MRVLLTAIFLLTANGAMALGEGRYVVTSLASSSFILTDTKTGKFRLCVKDTTSRTLFCNPWVDGLDEVQQEYEVRPPRN